MKLTRLLLVLLACFVFSGCSSYFEQYTLPRTRYWQVRVTNIRGELVADWIAQGGVWKTDRGYRFRAVQRTSAPPYMTVTRFPYGRKMEVTGANIVVTPAGKPYWLFALDRF